MGAARSSAVEMAMRPTIDQLERRLKKAHAAYARIQWRSHLERTNGNELNQMEAARAERGLVLRDSANPTTCAS